MTTTAFASKVGATARAMAEVQKNKHPTDEVSGRIICPKCGSGLRFTILPNGVSRGNCSAAGCVRWAELNRARDEAVKELGNG